MIGKLIGKIEGINKDNALINVLGVCYEVYLAENFLISLSLGQDINVYIHTNVKEDSITLYGFDTYEQKDIYLKLCTVSGVGPRIAMSILSSISINDLCYAIVSSDKTALKSLPGIGPKMAERIIIELKDKFQNKALYPQQDKKEEVLFKANKLEIINDAILALTSLGINRNDAINKVKDIVSKNDNIILNDIVKIVLKEGV
jgi:Holliday junction DNA helicase RuvA